MTFDRDFFLPSFGEYACEGLNVIWAFVIAVGFLLVYAIFEDWRDR